MFDRLGSLQIPLDPRDGPDTRSCTRILSPRIHVLQVGASRTSGHIAGRSPVLRSLYHAVRHGPSGGLDQQIWHIEHPLCCYVRSVMLREPGALAEPVGRRVSPQTSSDAASKENPLACAVRRAAIESSTAREPSQDLLTSWPHFCDHATQEPVSSKARRLIRNWHILDAMGHRFVPLVDPTGIE